MKLYKYVITKDSGFAPNPFYNYCTLSCCKPNVRRCAEEGDYVIGLTPWDKSRGNKVVYFMKVIEKLETQMYYNDKRFINKVPHSKNIYTKAGSGDNIYNYKKERYINITINNQKLTPRHYRKTHLIADIGKDNKNAFVLIANKNNFYYFGRDAVKLPSNQHAIGSQEGGPRRTWRASVYYSALSQP